MIYRIVLNDWPSDSGSLWLRAQTLADKFGWSGFSVGGQKGESFLTATAFQLHTVFNKLPSSRTLKNGRDSAKVSVFPYRG